MYVQMDIPSSLPFSRSFDYASGAIGNRFQNPFWRLTELLFGRQLSHAVAEVKRFGGVLVSAAAERRSNVVDCTDAGGLPFKRDDLRTNLIDSLLDHIDDKGVVADAAMNYLSAGIFSRYLLAFLFYKD